MLPMLMAVHRSRRGAERGGFGLRELLRLHILGSQQQEAAKCPLSFALWHLLLQVPLPHLWAFLLSLLPCYPSFQPRNVGLSQGSLAGQRLFLLTPPPQHPASPLPFQTCSLGEKSSWNSQSHRLLHISTQRPCDLGRPHFQPRCSSPS